MPVAADIVNRALQVIGTRSTVSPAELAANSTNEAIQANLIYVNIRRRLLRMAPWACSLKTANLVYITSSPGTPENTSPATTLWQPSQPAPPWAYEYQYPVDCVRACWLIPATQTGYAGGIPITTAVTGGAASFWQGPPVKFTVQTDTFTPVVSAVPAAAGTGYAAGDFITLAAGLSTNPPIGAPAILQVATVNGGGGILTASVVSQVYVADTDVAQTSLGGSYFTQQTNPVAQGSTTGVGTGATFNLVYTGPQPQRVILTNQEFATLVYCQDITNPAVMDDLFLDAFVKILGATLCMPLAGDKKLAQLAVQEANYAIAEARRGDGNEGLTINDVTPDWIRGRGIQYADPYSGPYSGFDWGAMWSWGG